MLLGGDESAGFAGGLLEDGLVEGFDRRHVDHAHGQASRGERFGGPQPFADIMPVDTMV